MEALPPRYGDLTLNIAYRSPGELKPSKRRLKKHPKKQLETLAASMRQFGFNNPIGIDAEDRIVVGAARNEAAKLLGLEQVPVIRLDHMTAEERRAYAIAENRLAELGSWDTRELSFELQELSKLELNFSMELTGFSGFELDNLLDGPADDSDGVIPALEATATSRTGDVWLLGPHRLICGDAREPLVYEQLLKGELARASLLDPPYNVPILGHVGGRGKKKPREFAMGSGEMSRDEFTAFLAAIFRPVAEHSIDGSIHFSFMDWRGSKEVQLAGEAVFDELKNVAVWVKHNAGLGRFYRSQHELCFIFKKGDAPHLNTFGLGGDGRFRTNVWSYPGANGYGEGRTEALAMHPTVKPVALLADAIRDVTHRGDLVLDAFGGSGSTLIAADKTRRRARLIEIDPLYCDVICRRWKLHSGEPAVLEQTGRPYEEGPATREDAADV